MSGEAFSEQLSCRNLLIPLLWPQLLFSARSHGRLMSMELGCCAARKGFWTCTAIIPLMNVEMMGVCVYSVSLSVCDSCKQEEAYKAFGWGPSYKAIEEECLHVGIGSNL